MVKHIAVVMTLSSLSCVVACNVEDPGFRCATDLHCASTMGVYGRCEASGYCSYLDDGCADTQRRYAEHSGSLSNQCVPVDPNGTALQVIESFDWSGPAAAVLLDAALQPVSNTVFWDPDLWDTRVGMASGSTSPGAAPAAAIDIRPGGTSLTQGLPELTYQAPAPGGPGLGVMHFVDAGLCSARLRNPVQVTVEAPLHVSFLASRAVTPGLFWEVLLTPASGVFSADTTSEALPVADAADFVSIGLQAVADTACTGEWQARVVVRRRIGQLQDRQQGAPFAIDPTRTMELLPYTLLIFTDRIIVGRDDDGDGYTDTAAIDVATIVPWTHAYVQLVGTAWPTAESSHSTCAADNEGARLLGWRDLRVDNLTYKSTAVFPQPGANAYNLGFATQDVRDLEHTGVIAGFAQPNEAAYDNNAPGIACHGAGAGACTEPVETLTLLLPLTASDLEHAALAQLVYDIRGTGTSTLAANSVSVGELIGQATLRPRSNSTWIQRSLTVPVSALLVGTNQLILSLSGDVDIDRVALELAYD